MWYNLNVADWSYAASGGHDTDFDAWEKSLTKAVEEYIILLECDAAPSNDTHCIFRTHPHGEKVATPAMLLAVHPLSIAFAHIASWQGCAW